MTYSENNYAAWEKWYEEAKERSRSFKIGGRILRIIPFEIEMGFLVASCQFYDGKNQHLARSLILEGVRSFNYNASELAEKLKLGGLNLSREFSNCQSEGLIESSVEGFDISDLGQNLLDRENRTYMRQIPIVLGGNGDFAVEETDARLQFKAGSPNPVDNETNTGRSVQFPQTLKVPWPQEFNFDHEKKKGELEDELDLMRLPLAECSFSQALSIETLSGASYLIQTANAECKWIHACDISSATPRYRKKLNQVVSKVIDARATKALSTHIPKTSDKALLRRISERVLTSSLNSDETKVLIPNSKRGSLKDLDSFESWRFLMRALMQDAAPLAIELGADSTNEFLKSIQPASLPKNSLLEIMMSAFDFDYIFDSPSQESRWNIVKGSTQLEGAVLLRFGSSILISDERIALTLCKDIDFGNFDFASLLYSEKA